MLTTLTLAYKGLLTGHPAAWLAWTMPLSVATSAANAQKSARDKTPGNPESLYSSSKALTASFKPTFMGMSGLIHPSQPPTQSWNARRKTYVNQSPI